MHSSVGIFPATTNPVNYGPGQKLNKVPAFCSLHLEFNSSTKGLILLSWSLLHVCYMFATCLFEGDEQLITPYCADRDKTYATYEGHLESKERFAIQRYLLIIGKKKNMQVL